MNIFQELAARRRQRKLTNRKVFVEEIGWTLQLPIDFEPQLIAKAQKDYEVSVKHMGGYDKDSIYHQDNSRAVFSARFDRFNMIAGSLCKSYGFSQQQIDRSRDDCKQKLLRLFSRIPQSKIEQSSSNFMVGGVSFEEHRFLVIRNGKPIFCFEYLCRIIGQYELSFSINYNNETRRQQMFKCMEDSSFA